MVALVIGMTGSLHRIWWLYLAVILTEGKKVNFIRILGVKNLFESFIGTAKV